MSSNIGCKPVKVLYHLQFNLNLVCGNTGELFVICPGCSKETSNSSLLKIVILNLNANQSSSITFTA